MDNKERFIQLLADTKREGIEETVNQIEALGFFEAPASTVYHGAYDGGLVQHCLNVYEQIMYLRKIQTKIRPDIEEVLTVESCTIASLLHDVCKSNYYKKTKKWRKNIDNKWEQYDSYEHDLSYLPIGHGEKSVIMLMKFGLKMTEAEMCAIRWHMGAFDLSTYTDSQKGFNAACDAHPLAALLVSADWLASRFTETRKAN